MKLPWMSLLLAVACGQQSRFTEGVEKALQLANGLVVLNYRDHDHLFSQLLALEWPWESLSR